MSFQCLPREIHAIVSSYIGSGTPGDYVRTFARPVEFRTVVKYPGNDFLFETTHTYINGLLHSIRDKPAVVHANGTQEWWSHGQLHRDTGPAVIYMDGDKIWYQNGRRHREGAPAVICTNGTQIWYSRGRRHRESAPAVIANGTLEWWVEGRRHREDGPAIINHNAQYWFNHGRLHRSHNQPAVVTPRNRNNQWYIYGVRYK